MPADVLRFPCASLSLHDQASRAAARGRLESYRQARLCDQPFKTPRAVPLTLIRDAGLPVLFGDDPNGPQPGATWAQIAAVTAK